MKIYKKVIDTKLGKILICANDIGITEVRFVEDYIPAIENKWIISCEKQLQEYFKGTRKYFDVPLVLEGTDFQKKVWKELAKIPYGKIKSYKDIAQEIKNPKAMRAVGMANNRNKICILIPCHRVINANGNIGGYEFGTNIKEKLIKHEKETQ